PAEQNIRRDGHDQAESRPGRARENERRDLAEYPERDRSPEPFGVAAHQSKLVGYVTARSAEADSFSGRLRGLTRAQPGPGIHVARRVDSASIGPCTGQITVSCRGRVHRRPHRWQQMLVPAGFTQITRRPASSALPARIWMNWAQPASGVVEVAVIGQQ